MTDEDKLRFATDMKSIFHVFRDFGITLMIVLSFPVYIAVSTYHALMEKMKNE